jgi:hypothetical protein
MTMSKLRDEIARAVARAVDRAMDGERAMTPPPLGGWHPLVTDAADAILAKVREALLSDEALEKGAIAMLGATFEFPGAGERIWTEINVDDNPYGTRFDTGSPDKVLSEARATITAALDAVATD